VYAESAAAAAVGPNYRYARAPVVLTAGEHVFRSDVADGAIQADVVVMLNIALHKCQRSVFPFD
jgi:hypothetical protein